MKKVALFLIMFAAGLSLIFYALYKADLIRMANNQPVIFSTWGYDYADIDLEGEITDDEVVYARIEDETLTSRGVVVDVFNVGQNSAVFGDYYTVERKTGSRWIKLNYVTGEAPDWNDMNYIVDPENNAAFSFYWSDIYGELGPGKYRVGKLYIIDDGSNEIRNLYCEFEIK